MCLKMLQLESAHLSRQKMITEITKDIESVIYCEKVVLLLQTGKLLEGTDNKHQVLIPVQNKGLI